VNRKNTLGLLINIPNWEDASNYPDPAEATLHDWAWEFIRRSPDYRKDWARFQEIVGNNPGIEKEIERYKKHTSDLLEQHTVRKKSKGEKGVDAQVYSFPPLFGNTDKNRREKQAQVNSEIWNLLNKWPFQLFLPEPRLNWREIDALNGVWWKQSYSPKIILPGIEMRPHFYGISKPDRFSVIFSLEYLWEPQAKHVKDNAMDISKAFRNGLLHSKEDVSLESPWIDYESRHAQLPNSSVFRLGTVEIPSIGYSFKREKAFKRELVEQLVSAKYDFIKAATNHIQTSARNVRNKYQLYIRILDAIANNVKPYQYGPVLYENWVNESSEEKDLYRTLRNDQIAAEKLQNSGILKLLVTPSSK